MVNLYFSAAVQFVSSVIFFYVGYTILGRKVSTESRLALSAFSLWWVGLGLSTLLTSGLILAARQGFTHLALHEAALHLQLVLICVILWGLLYYLLYLYTGRRWLVYAVGVFYVLYYMTLVYWVAWQNPTHVELERWRVVMKYERESTNAVLQLIVALLVLPQIIGAIAYFRLYFFADHPVQKYRIALVSLSILVWFSTALISSLAQISTSDTGQVISRMVSLGAALTVLMAYRPPKWIRERLAMAKAGPVAATGGD